MQRFPQSPDAGTIRVVRIWMIFLLVMLSSGAVVAADDIPARPEEIPFGDLEFTPPDRGEFRHELSNGVVVYLLPDRTLPLVDVAFSFSGGAYLAPKGKEGLAGLTGAMIRRGGTTAISPAELDERFDFLAADVSSSVGDTQSSARLNCLADNFDEAFSLFVAMLSTPGFDGDRLTTVRAETIESLKQRNDQARDIQRREWAGLLYGWDHFEVRPPTQTSVESITKDDLEAFHALIFHPGNLVVGVTGDFEAKSMLAALSGAFESWAAGSRPASPPAPTQELEGGVYHVEKDIPQGRVVLGMRSLKRDHPDATTLRVMNWILGGGGFTSRIMNKVRTEEGLAYSAGSSFRPKVHYGGEFRAYFQSKSRTVALAIKLILEEIRRIREEPVSEEELSAAKASIIETFPRLFESRPTVRDLFVSEEWDPRPHRFYENYRDRVRALTIEDIQRVAREHLDPDKLAILLVGKWSEIESGDLEGRARMNEFGDAVELPLRDPLTMDPISP